MAKRSKSSQRWLTEHEDDLYVKKARLEGYRSRAAYKLIEIDEKYRLLKPGQVIVDLGAAPGGWTQVAVRRTGHQGRVIATDILAMEPVEGATFVQGDFTTDEVLEALLAEIGSEGVDLVISDMAPNLSGMNDIDQPRVTYLIELAIELAGRVLRKKGALLVKCFEGEGIDDLRGQFRAQFGQVTNFKPAASRGKSREIYLLGRGFDGSSNV